MDCNENIAERDFAPTIETDGWTTPMEIPLEWLESEDWEIYEGEDEWQKK